MNNLKLFKKSDNQFPYLLKLLKQFSDEFGMEFGLEKCAEDIFLWGKFKQTYNMEIDKATSDQSTLY